MNSNLKGKYGVIIVNCGEEDAVWRPTSGKYDTPDLVVDSYWEASEFIAEGLRKRADRERELAEMVRARECLMAEQLLRGWESATNEYIVYPAGMKSVWTLVQSLKTEIEELKRVIP